MYCCEPGIDSVNPMVRDTLASEDAWYHKFLPPHRDYAQHAFVQYLHKEFPIDEELSDAPLITAMKRVLQNILFIEALYW